MISLYKIKDITPENLDFPLKENINKAIILVEMPEEMQANIDSMFCTAMDRGEGFHSDFEKFRLFLHNWINKHIPALRQSTCRQETEIYLEKLYILLSCKTILKDRLPQAKDYAFALGEQIMAWLLSQSLDHAVYYAAGHLFKTKGSFGSATLVEEESAENIKQHFSHNYTYYILPARFGKDKDGCVMLMHPEEQQKAANLFYNILVKKTQRIAKPA